MNENKARRQGDTTLPQKENKAKTMSWYSVSLVGLVFAGGWLAIIASVAAYLGAHHWLMELVTHFKVQLGLSLAFAALVALVARQKMHVLVFTLFAALNLMYLIPLYLGGAQAAAPGEQTFTVMTVNVNGYNSNYYGVREAIIAADADVILINEVTPKWHQELQSLAERWPNTQEAPREGCFGIMLLSKFPLIRPQAIDPIKNRKLSISAEIEFAGNQIRLFGTHPPPPKNLKIASERDRQLRAIGDMALQGGGPIIVLGDFNMTRFSPLFKTLIKRSLTNTEDGFGFQPTWPADKWQTLPLSIMIDHVLVSDELRVLDREVLPIPGSDHRAVRVTLAIAPKEQATK